MCRKSRNVDSPPAEFADLLIKGARTSQVPPHVILLRVMR
ncbi:hypothetical protein I548_0383 [Mycobacterium intracellulare]|nr:hypothetical protein I548_0383 [Mycobacterium intracellulare]